MIRYAKLDIKVDIDDLKIQTGKFINNSNWHPHFNTFYFDGEWEVLSLRSPGGATESIIPDLINNSVYSDTSLMAEFPSVQLLLSKLECTIMSVRLLNLKSGAVIKPHRDPELCLEMGEARLHFPVFTNPLVEFFVDQDRVIMNEGDCWYINANRFHRVANQGASDRIHLVVDCQVNDWLKNLFERAEKVLTEENENDAEIIKIITELRLQNTETSNKIADSLAEKIRLNSSGD